MEERLSRRLLVLRVAALGGTSVAVSACVAPGPAYYGNPAPVLIPRGTGMTDADPSDGPGQGRGGSRVGGGYRTGLTDADPNDGPGQGRGGHRGNPYRTGLTDSDPNDGPGQGRGGNRGGSYRTGRTDSDPRDAPGRGRY